MNAWDRMLFGVAIVFLLFKSLTSRKLALRRTLSYWALWPGMDPRPFAETVPGNGTGLMAWGAAKMALGATLLLIRTGREEIDVVLIFLGIGFLVHFGLFEALTGFWRGRGIAVERLFVNPAASRTLGEFWGRRWNLAFHAVARERVYQPVARRWGPVAGILATFFFSGLLHEALISVPAAGGYGLPTTYFMLQGVLVLVERRWNLGGRLWANFWVLAPLPLLFHPWFVRTVIRPLL